MKKRCLSLLLVLCLIVSMVPTLGANVDAAPANPLQLTKEEGSGRAFIYYDFLETTEFLQGETYAFLDSVYDQNDALAQLSSGAVLQAIEYTNSNDCNFYIRFFYGSDAVASVYVKVVTPGKGFDNCPIGGLYKMPNTSAPTEYRYFCWAGGAKNCGPLYAYTYQTAEITWEDVTIYLNEPSNTQSNNSSDYTVLLNYDDNQSVTLDPRSYTVQCNGKTAVMTITDNAENVIEEIGRAHV